MEDLKEIKDLVKQKYGKIASQSEESCCCCGCEPEAEKDYTVFSDSYEHLDGYIKDADLNLGCGLPTEFASIKPGDHVLDLGSGAGNDCFVARVETGETGKVTGLDFTPEMNAKARENAAKLNFNNVEFIEGDIENIPLHNGSQDVVISNCVLNLVPDKTKAFSEIFRVLKSGGHFCISDVVIKGDLPDGLKNEAELYAGCVSGALQMDDYLGIISEAGFADVDIKKSKEVTLPDEMLRKYLGEIELESFKNSGTGIFSITVTAEKL
jgi:ubiquinone/menaquinone biosynthesis C-methylase UbiE